MDAPVEEEALADVEEEDVAEEEAPPPPPCVLPEEPCISEACHAPPFALECVGGWILDGAGDPIPGQGVSPCVHDVCYRASTREDGWFAVPLPPDPPIEVIKFSFPGTGPRLRPFCRLDALCDGSVHLCATFVLREGPTSGTAIPEGELAGEIRVEAEDGAALLLPAGAEIEISPGAERWMALSRYPLEEDAPCFVDPADPPLALYAVTPSSSYVFVPSSHTMTPAGLDLPNPTGLAPGAEVDVWVLGGVYTTHIDIEEGDWIRRAGAVVSMDGARIRTRPGEGIGYLTWFGVYLP
jgi:hypothetical protein